jgi:hypothetical protein
LDGIVIQSGSNNDVIGGDTFAARNLISGNGSSGMQIVASSGTRVQGNFIGNRRRTALLLSEMQNIGVFSHQ